MLVSNLSDDLQSIYTEACRVPFAQQASDLCHVAMDKGEIERILPHRDPMLMLDRVSIVDRQYQLLVAHCDLTRAKKIADCYDSSQAIFPPVFQVEAMGQAGALYLLSQKQDTWKNAGSAFTHICHACFVQSILLDGSEIELQARVFEEDLFDIIIGQCIWRKQICATVILRGISKN